MKKIQMVDLGSQYEKIKAEINTHVLDCLDSGAFINGPYVTGFKDHLATYLDAACVIPCANGTDALQIALMTLNLEPGDEVIVPAFTYVATAEVIALLQLKPKMVDVCPDSFNVTVAHIEKAISPKTKAVVPVHLFGQCCDMEAIEEFSRDNGIHIVEDNAQAIGASYTYKDGRQIKSGLLGDIGCTSFYPSKNLGAFGDGGALYTNNEILGERAKMIANHGQNKRYYHDVVGVNSRLDSIQAAILDIKLKHLDTYIKNRQRLADIYDNALKDIPEIQIPVRQSNSTHVFHQYTLRIKNGKRDAFQSFLKEKDIPSMIYYPVPLYRQKAYQHFVSSDFELPNTELLCNEVLSLPMHTEMDAEQSEYICAQIIDFFR